MTDAEPHLEDRQLLHDYVERCSGSAFAELVRRHVDAVYSAALRRVNGDRALAEDVVQCVFTDFARKAAQLPSGTVPGGWLHRHTGFVASHHIDRERRRRAREQQAVAMNALTDAAEDATWQRTAPLLDEALDELPTSDRDAIVLRFFEKRDFRAVGHALGVSDDTAQKRVSRALEKLRGLLTGRGVTSTGAALSAIMLANTVTQAPAALVSALPSRSLAGAATAGGTLISASAGLSLAARWKLAAMAAVLLAAGAAPFLIQRAGQQAGALSTPGSPAVIPPGPVDAARSPAPISAATPGAPQSTAEIISAAAAALKGGAQNVSAVTKALALLTSISVQKEENAEAALGLISAVPDVLARTLLYKYFLSYWAETAPSLAVNYATTRLPEEQRLSTAEGVLTAWAARDPEAVIEWDHKGRYSIAAPVHDALVATIFKSLASTDFSKAFLQLSKIKIANERAQALQGIMNAALSPQARERIITASATMTDADIRVQTRRAIVESWAGQEPTEAAAWIDTVEPVWERPRLMDSLGLVWLQKNPGEAASWWLAREPGPDTLVKIINVWSQKDPNAAGEWLKAQPPGPQNDAARMTFARQVADLDPESALQWATTVSDETMRRSATEHILKNWRASNPAAAARYEAKEP